MTDPKTALAKVANPEDAFAARTQELHDAIAQAHQQIETSLTNLQTEADETVTNLQAEFQERFDPRGWVQRHPWRVVGICVAVGFYFGLRD